ncbi:MAG: class I SAM-dependent methyltransferase [Candidatus Micrarchaeota archaeon]|nr:class I SAM-dependent methyltransferase [Candidatus Micrarchaeota archaeon]
MLMGSKLKGPEQYPHRVAKIWDNYVDWGSRRSAENGFFTKLLVSHGISRGARILDMAAGTGFHSIGLAREGFKVTACDGSPHMLNVLRDNARKNNVDVASLQAYWNSLDSVLPPGNFDACICLGNSFTHVSFEERETVLAQIAMLLSPGGIYVFDHRNFERIIETGEINGGSIYRKDAKISVIRATSELVEVSYTVKGVTFPLSYHPVFFEKVPEMLQKAGFGPLEFYGDFKKGERDASFFQWVAEKMT